MNFNTAITQVMILFIILFIGAAAKKTKLFNDNTENSISSILLNVSLPALVLSSGNFDRTDEVIANIISILLITVVSYVITIFLCMLLTKTLRLEKKIANVFTSLIVFSNIGFMGFPIARAFFGDIGVFYSSIINFMFNMLLWTYGILLFNNQGKINFKKLLNPGSISTFIVLFMFLFQLKLPYTFQSSFEAIGSMTTPLSMLLVGSLIAEIDIAKLVSNKNVYLVAIFRLIIIPIITLFVLKYMGFNNMVTSICTLMAAMPSGAINAIMAKQFNSEPIFASTGVFITTLLSIITLPLIVYMITCFIV